MFENLPHPLCPDPRARVRVGALPILLQALLRRRSRGENAPPNLLLREQGAAALHPVGPGSAGRRAGQENAPLAGDPGEHLLVLGRRVVVQGQGGSSAPGSCLPNLAQKPQRLPRTVLALGFTGHFPGGRVPCRAQGGGSVTLAILRQRRTAPLGQRPAGRVRSRAWTRLRSSQLCTAALRGGSRCSPTPAHSCSSKPGSWLSGKVRIRCGWSP